MQGAAQNSIKPTVLAVLLCVFLYGAFGSESVERLVAFEIIAVASLTPLAIWIWRGASGLPILPISAAFYLLYYALPIASNNLELRAQGYSDEAVLSASFLVVSFLVTATAVWLAFPRPKATADELRKGLDYKGLDYKGVYKVIFACFTVGFIYFIGLYGDLISSLGSFLGLFRAAALTANGIGCFLLGLSIGKKYLTGAQAGIGYALIVVNVVLQWGSLFLVGGVTNILAALLGYVLTARRVPWKTSLVAFAVVSVLHAGKAEMRQMYWEPNSNSVVQMSIFDVPGILFDWTEFGLANVATSGKKSALERTSLIQMVLYAQSMAPQIVPFLNGESYSFFLNAMVPRFLDANKAATQAAQTLLNIRFGLQTAETAAVTAIGWGPVAEGYANFGFIGVIFAGVFIGLVCTLIERWSSGAPVFSFAGLGGIAALLSLINLEADLTYLFSNLIQALSAAAIAATGIGMFSKNRRKARPPSGRLARAAPSLAWDVGRLDMKSRWPKHRPPS